jgi:hypothetical protein
VFYNADKFYLKVASWLDSAKPLQPPILFYDYFTLLGPYRGGFGAAIPGHVLERPFRQLLLRDPPSLRLRVAPPLAIRRRSVTALL